MTDKKAHVDERSHLTGYPAAGPSQPQPQDAPQSYQSFPAQYTMSGPAYVPGPPGMPMNGGDPYAAAVRAADERASSRFWTALLYGFGFWIILGLFTGGITMDEVSHHRRTGHRHGFERVPSGLPVRVEECQGFKIHENDLQYGPTLMESKMNIKIHVEEKDTIYFHSTGGWSHGSLELVRDDSLSKAVVEVVAQYDDEDLLEEARVCEVSHGTTKGIEVWTPDRTDHGEYDHSRLQFVITYRLPFDSFQALNITSSIFSVHSNDSWKFADSEIRVSNAAITLKGLASLDSKLRTSNSAIRIDTFKTSTGLLSTSNGHVDLPDSSSDSLTVRSSNAAIRGSFKVQHKLILSSSNSPITADVDLLGEDDKSAHEVSVSSTNAPVTLNYLSQPRGSSLTSTASSSNSPVKVVHAAEYTGSFDVSTSLMGVVVKQVHSNEGKRERFIERISWSGSHARGSIGWKTSKGDKTISEGQSKVSTSNGRAELQY